MSYFGIPVRNGLPIGLGSVAPLGANNSFFSPASFFANGEQGWWYDPSNFATLFQDSAGTTPVTAVEQPVGLQLDLSKGLVLGPELVTNGDFSNGTTGWTAATSTLSVVSGELIVTATSNSSYPKAYRDFSCVVGKIYEVSATARVISSPSRAGLSIVNVGGVFVGPEASTASPTNTTIKFIFTATSTTHYVAVSAAGATPASTGNTFAFDNISVKELPGNHRFQTTSANRPVVSARVNLLTKTEQFDDAVWVKYQASVAANSTVSPDGTTTADSLINDGTNNFHGLRNAPFAAFSSPVTHSVYAKAGTLSNISLSLTSANPYTTDGAVATFDLTAGTVSKTAGPAYVSSTITSVGNGWYRCSLTASNASLIYGWTWLNSTNNPTYAGFGYETFAGTAGQTVYLWGADLRPTNIGVNLPPYQRVNTSTDYDSTGFPVYIKPNGSNQFMQTNSINFSATDKMTVWQGVRKLSDASNAVLLELGVGGSTGGFSMFAPVSPDLYAWLGNGNIYSFATQAARTTSSSYNAPNTSVITGLGNISGDLNTLRINGAQVATATGDQGTGNYGNFSAYFYARTGTAVFFNGHDYGSIARGAASTAAQITNGEAYINSKTKAYT